MNEISPDQAFNYHRTPYEPRHVIADPPVRLRGDILLWQVLTKITPQWLFEVISTFWGLIGLVIDLLKWAVDSWILDPIQRRRWRQGKR